MSEPVRLFDLEAVGSFRTRFDRSRARCSPCSPVATVERSNLKTLERPLPNQRSPTACDPLLPSTPTLRALGSLLEPQAQRYAFSQSMFDGCPRARGLADLVSPPTYFGILSRGWPASARAISACQRGSAPRGKSADWHESPRAPALSVHGEARLPAEDAHPALGGEEVCYGDLVEGDRTLAFPPFSREA